MLKQLSIEQMEKRYFDDGSLSCYKGIITTPFSIEVAKECTNLWQEESYTDIIISKAVKLYKSYIKIGRYLVGQGECIGILVLFSGKAYRGMGALGCSFNRARGVGIITDKNSKIYKVLSDKGLESKIKNISANSKQSSKYTLASIIVQTTYPNSYTGFMFNVGLVGENKDIVDLVKGWSDCFTLDLTDDSN